MSDYNMIPVREAFEECIEKINLESKNCGRRSGRLNKDFVIDLIKDLENKLYPKK